MIHEFILFYAKKITELSNRFLPRTVKEVNGIKTLDNDSRGLMEVWGLASF